METNNARASVIVVGVLLLVIVVALLRQRDGRPSPIIPTGGVTSPTSASASLPRLVEIGGEKCIPCREMAPILESIKAEYSGRLEVETIDLEKVPLAQKIYAVRLIPTQVFLKSNGEEFWRNEGTLTREEIVLKLGEMGVR
ncbi:MAG: thioredoxin family protein [Candidatus Omnitrophica bacterium]|nr:hypothetical protein [bacterium]NUN95861.1 thioredoxin family protein [Candidatus Omnitrophota bacterium]